MPGTLAVGAIVVRTVHAGESERESTAEQMENYRLVVPATLATVPTPGRVSVRTGINLHDRGCSVERVRHDDARAENCSEHCCRLDQRSARYVGRVGANLPGQSADPLLDQIARDEPNRSSARRGLFPEGDVQNG